MAVESRRDSKLTRGTSAPRQSPAGSWLIGARAHGKTTCKTSTCRFPLGAFVAVTGVSGSRQEFAGQRDALPDARPPTASRPHRRRPLTTTFVGLEHIDKVINVDQDPIGNTPSSNPATYTGVFDLDPPIVRPAAGIEGARLSARSASASTNRAAAARRARATDRRKSRCTFCRMSGSSATSATASATIRRRWPFATRATPSPTC